jgi:hypothetical protein
VSAVRPGAALLAVSALALTGCVSTGNAGGVPDCAADQTKQLALMAQAVPTAKLIPCVRSVPTGWRFDGADVRSGEAQFWLSSDRDGDRAVTVLLRRRCDTAGSTGVVSEQAGATRHEKVTRVTTGYGGERHYRFAGGCVTYRFNLQGTTRAEPVAAVSQSLGFVSRRAIEDRINAKSDGRLELDPEPR